MTGPNTILHQKTVMTNGVQVRTKNYIFYSIYRVSQKTPLSTIVTPILTRRFLGHLVFDARVATRILQRLLRRAS